MASGIRSRPRSRLVRRGSTAALLAVAAVLAVGGPASAHVHVDGTDVTQGGYGVLTFRVPTESDTASTTGLTVTFPKDTPIADVSTQPIAGWTATVQQGKLSTPIQTDDGPVSDYVESVTWTADSAEAGIEPGQFQEFAVSAGPLPSVASIVLPALQSYSDGTTVNWNEQAATGAAEPEHPVPELLIPPATDEQATAATSSPTSSAPQAESASPSVSSSSADDDDDPASWPGWVGLAAGVAALLVAGLALARAGRGPAER